MSRGTARVLRLAMLAVAVQLPVLAQTAPAADLAILPPAVVRDSLEAALIRFNYRWAGYWRLSVNARQSRSRMTEAALQARNSYMHCHPEQDAGFAGVHDASMVRGGQGSFAVCPSWMLGDEPWPDERGGIDAILEERFREPVRAERDSLLTMFERAVHWIPRDDWLAGQLVRLAVEQGELARAADLASSCAASAWWCGVLAAYVTALRGDVVEAESAFVAAVRAMPPEQRCQWTDVSLLIDSSARAIYRRTPCGSRDGFHERFWWLSDPLWKAPGNARRVDHFVRRTRVALHSAHGQDERFDWRPGAGGEALASTVVRYGWPSLMFWVHEAMDASHSGYLYDRTTALNANYTTFEYSPGRLATVPRWRAFEDPLATRADDWAISDPLAMDTIPVRRSPWWPQEHYRPERTLVQLEGGQVAMLRRQRDVLMNTAIELPQVHRGLHPGIDSAVLVLSPGPGRFTSHALRRLDARAAFVTQAGIDTGAVVASIEFDAATDSGPPGGRVRFGIAPPTMLASMRPGEIAISDPVVLRAPSGDAVLPMDTERALELMATSTTAPADGRIGVYWETYGIKPGDTVDVAVWVERYTPQGIARRLGIVLNIAEDLNTPVVASWREPQPSRRVHAIDGLVPIIARSLVLDVSGLPAGDYWLDVAVSTPRHEAVRGRRSITIK